MEDGVLINIQQYRICQLNESEFVCVLRERRKEGERESGEDNHITDNPGDLDTIFCSLYGRTRLCRNKITCCQRRCCFHLFHANLVIINRICRTESHVYRLQFAHILYGTIHC